jgi:negative regulator of sigma E activity
MSNYVTEELISAYIDGEVTADERAHVEKALAGSAKLQQVFQELKDLRSDLQSLPRFKLPDDFALQVLERAERAAPSAATRAGRFARELSESTLPRRQNRLRVWKSVATVAATLAVGLLFALVYVAQQNGSAPQDPPDRVGEQLVGGPEPAPVPPEQSPDRVPGVNEDQFAKAEFDRAKYVFIVDLTLTPQAQEDHVFREAMRSAGIQFDPAIRVEEDLETALLENRFLGDVEKVVPGDALVRAADEIEMVYVSGNAQQVNQAIADLQSRQRDEITRVRFDMAIEPKERDVFRRLNEAIRFADQEPSSGPRARPLLFSFALQSTSGGFFAGMSTPLSGLESLPQRPAATTGMPPSAASEVPSSPRQDASARESLSRVPMVDVHQGGSLTGDSLMIFEVLFVLRNLREAP